LVVCLLFYIDGIVEDSTKSQIFLSIIWTLSASLTTLLLLKWSFIGIKGINCVSFYDSSIGFLKCSDNVAYLFFTLFLCTIFYKNEYAIDTTCNPITETAGREPAMSIKRHIQNTENIDTFVSSS